MSKMKEMIPKIKTFSRKAGVFISNHRMAKLAVLALAEVLFLETYIRFNPLMTLWWVVTSPIALILNVLILTAVLSVIQGIVNHSRVTALLSVLLVFLYGTINVYKFKNLGQYFYPWDTHSAGELEGISQNLMHLDYTCFIVFFVVMVAFIVMVFRNRNLASKLMKFSLVQRAGLLCLSMLLVLGIVNRDEWHMRDLFNGIGIHNYAWAQAQSYMTNGATLGFALSYKLSEVEKPTGYTKANLEAINLEMRHMFDTTSYPQPPANYKKPNIVVVMSESLWDPNQLNKLHFSQNPAANLEADSISNFISPTFGGYTCNVEFEFLTSMNMRFLPEGSSPYQQFVHQDIPSLPKEFSANGYQTTAIHPYYGWFWNRENVYKHLGFDKFIDITGFNKAKKRGFYISDDSVVDKITDTLDHSDKPSFIFAVTIQNHGPYGDNRYKQTETSIDGLDPSVDNQIVKTYTQGVLEYDRAYKKLTNYVDKSGRPTLVLTFGDHLPALGDNYQMYQKYGFVQDGISSYYQRPVTEQLGLHRTMMATHSNTKKLELPGYISPSMISGYLLSYADATMSDYYKMIYLQGKKAPCPFGNYSVAGDGTLKALDGTDMKKYGSVEYDLLIGKQYFLDQKYAEKNNQPIAKPQTFSALSAAMNP